MRGLLLWKRAAIVLGVLGLLAGCSSSSSAASGAAASACVDAWSAISDFMGGTRDAQSTVGALRDAAGRERDAADIDSRYTPVARWIVGAESEIASGGPGANAGHLYAECGPGRRK